MILLDTSGLFAFVNALEPGHEEARTILESEREPLVLSPFVLCELDYLLAQRSGVAGELDVLEDVASGAYWLVPFTPEDVSAAREVIERYRDLAIGLADASIVVLAGRYRTNRVLTLDERHFRALLTPDGQPFKILPTDA